MVIISLLCSLNKTHKRLYFYYYLNAWLNLACSVINSHAFFYTAVFCYISFKTLCIFLLICVYSVFLNNVPLSGELWEINYVDAVCLYLKTVNLELAAEASASLYQETEGLWWKAEECSGSLDTVVHRCWWGLELLWRSRSEISFYFPFWVQLGCRPVSWYHPGPEWVFFPLH